MAAPPGALVMVATLRSDRMRSTRGFGHGRHPQVRQNVSHIQVAYLGHHGGFDHDVSAGEISMNYGRVEAVEEGQTAGRVV